MYSESKRCSYVMKLFSSSLKKYATVLLFLIFSEYTFISLILQSYSDPMLVNSFVLTYKLITYGLLFAVLLYLPITTTVLLPAIIFFLCYSLLRLFFDGSLSNVFFSFPIFILAFFSARKMPELFLRGFKLLIICNVFLVAVQFLGLHEVFYWLSHSSPDPVSSFSYLQADEYLPQHQHRPHGMFASTIQLSLFEYFVIVMLVLTPNIPAIYYLLFGNLLVLTGSTTGFLLLGISLLFSLVQRKMLYVLFSGLFALAVLSTWFPYFVDANFSFDIIKSRFTSRLDIDASHSFIAKFNFVYLFDYLPLLFSSAAFFILVVAFFYGLRFSILCFFTLSVLLMLLFNHPIVNDMRYSFLWAVVISHLYYRSLDSRINRCVKRDGVTQA